MVVAAMVATAIAAWTAAGVVDVQPAQEVADVAESIVTSGPCPDGWGFESQTTLDTVVRACLKGDWIVFLGEGDAFDHAGHKDAASGFIDRFVETPYEVPNWPAP